MKINKITKIAALSAIAALLQQMAWFLPKVGGFLDIELSDFPAIIASLALGPSAGVITELIKNIIHLPFSTTGYVGELANFIVNGVFVLTIGLIYRFNKTKKGAALALVFGTLIMTAAAIITNRLLLLPLFMNGAPSSVYWSTIFTFITPFNLIRGIVLSAITFLSYKKLRILLK